MHNKISCHTKKFRHTNCHVTQSLLRMYSERESVQERRNRVEVSNNSMFIIISSQ